MIGFLRGKVVQLLTDYCLLDVGGVGYRVQTSITTQKQLKLNTETMLYTYMNVREDAMELYGFASKGELSTFKMLIGITGVGPKVALAILSELSSEQIAMCVSSGDSKTLTRASGVGPKLAQRIVLELKDKIKGIAESEGFEISKGSVVVDTGNVPKAVAALAVLGYSAADVTPILSKLDPNLSVEAMIAATLKQMA